MLFKVIYCLCVCAYLALLLLKPHVIEQLRVSASERGIISFILETCNTADTFFTRIKSCMYLFRLRKANLCRCKLLAYSD